MTVGWGLGYSLPTTTTCAGLLQVDTEKKQVTVEAGILLADLHPQLGKHSLALSK